MEACEMGRAPRIEYEGAVYHVTNRGNGQEMIYREEADWKAFLGIMSDVVSSCTARCTAGPVPSSPETGWVEASPAADGSGCPSDNTCRSASQTRRQRRS